MIGRNPHHPFYYYWTSICRECTYANGGTNNGTEYQFNLLQTMVSFKQFNRMDELIQNILAFLNMVAQQKRWTPYRLQTGTPTDKELKHRFELSDFWLEEPNRIIARSSDEWKYDVCSFTNEQIMKYEVDLFYMTCSCSTYLWNGYHCCHLLAVGRMVMFGEGLECHNCPRQTMYSVDLFIHDRQSYDKMRDELHVAKRKVLSGSRARKPPPKKKQSRREQVAELTTTSLHCRTELLNLQS
jgi:hypothetical protein